jgi:hypothetical protein
MLLQTWLTDLQSADANERLEAALILGTLDEAAALDAVAAQYQAEADAKVKATLSWAGKRLHAARQAGFTTLDAIFQHFRINDEIHPPQDDAAQQELMRKLQYQMEMDALRQQEAAAGSKVVTRMARATMFGLPGLLMAAIPESTSLEVRSLEPVNQPRRRTPATRPADTDITMLLRRLAYETEWQKRARAASDLAVIINNPQSIPHLARAFVQDRSPQVREAAQSAAKLLYWNNIYWHMNEDGSLAAEIARRSGKAPAAPEAPAPPVDAPAADDWLVNEADTPSGEAVVQEVLKPRRSLIHADKSSVDKVTAPIVEDDFLAVEYVEKRKPAVKPRKSRSSGTVLLALVLAMVVLFVGGIVVIVLEGARVVQEVVTNPELVNMVNALAATPEGYDTLPANLNRRGTLERFQPVQGFVIPGVDDAWTFSAEAGDEVTLMTLVPPESLYPRLFLYDPNGRLLASRADEISVALNTPLAITLPESGHYTAVVSAPVLETEYELTLQYVPQLGG